MNDWKAQQMARAAAAKALQAANPHLVPVGDQRGKNDSLIGRELQRRTWALTKAAPASSTIVDEVAA